MAVFKESVGPYVTRSLKDLKNTLFFVKTPLSKEDFRFITAALLIEANEMGGLQKNKIRLRINILKTLKKINAIKKEKERASLQKIWADAHGKSSGIPALAGVELQ